MSKKKKQRKEYVIDESLETTPTLICLRCSHVERGIVPTILSCGLTQGGTLIIGDEKYTQPHWCPLYRDLR